MAGKIPSRPDDVCIIGAGPAGAVLASKLAAAGLSVTLFEHGRRFSAEERRTLLDNRRRGSEPSTFNHTLGEADQIPYTALEASGFTYFHSRVPAVGGSSLHWSAHCPRPTHSDLDAFPLSYAALEPWLGLAEEELGVAGDVDDGEAPPRSKPFPMAAHARSYFEREMLDPACKKLGWALTSNPVAIASKPYRGRVACQACRMCELCPSGARYSADTAHVESFEKLPHARLFAETRVRRLTLGGDGRASHAVVVDRKTGEVSEVAARTFVIAAGGVESTRLLLLTQADSKKPTLDQLGKGFADNVLVAGQLLLPKDVGYGLGFTTTVINHFRHHFDKKRSGAFKLQAYPRLVDRKTLVNWLVHRGRLGPDAVGEAARRCVTLVAMVEKERNGSIDLDPGKKDAFGDRVARVVLPLSARDQTTMELAATAIDQLGVALGATMLENGHRNGQLLWGAHPFGAAAMAKTVKDGVCDANLRVFGMDNVYVLGSAAFPGFGATNPTLTIVALALRLADQLGKKP